MIRIGSLLNGRYQILAKLGEGGFAFVYHARDLELGRDVAVKVLKPIGMNAQFDQHRFLRESKTLAQLEHPNIVKAFSAEIYGNTPMIVMEYLEGQDLGQFINAKGPLGPDVLKKIFLQVCRGLLHAHDRGVIHRDLASNNVLLLDSSADSVKIIDFGLAMLFSSSDSANLTITQTGAILGNPAYMSPEQCRGERLDVRSDIYSLGCILYEALSGHSPFGSESHIELLMSHQTRYPKRPKPSWNNASLEALFCDIALKCMQKKREERFQSVDEILALLTHSGMGETATFSALDPWDNLVRNSQARNQSFAKIMFVTGCLGLFWLLLTLLPHILLHLHFSCLQDLKISIAARVKKNNPTLSRRLIDDVLVHGKGSLSPKSKAACMVSLAELQPEDAYETALHLLEEAAESSLHQSGLDSQIGSIYRTLGTLTVRIDPVSRELALRATLLQEVADSGQDAILAKQMLDSLLSRCRTFCAQSQLEQVKADQQLMKALAVAANSAITRFNLGISNDDIRYCDMNCCPQQAFTLMNTVLRINKLPEGLAEAIRGDRAHYLESLRPDLLLKSVLKELHQVKGGSERLHLLCTAAKLELEAADLNNAYRHTVEAENLIPEVLEIWPHSKTEALEEFFSVFEIQARCSSNLGRADRVRACCESAVSLLPTRSELQIPDFDSHHELDLKGKFGVFRTAKVCQGETKVTHKLFHRCIKLTLEASQVDLAENCLRRYLVLLEAFPLNPYDPKLQRLDHKLWQDEQEQFQSYLKNHVGKSKLGWRCRDLIKSIDFLLRKSSIQLN